MIDLFMILQERDYAVNTAADTRGNLPLSGTREQTRWRSFQPACYNAPLKAAIDPRPRQYVAYFYLNSSSPIFLLRQTLFIHRPSAQPRGRVDGVLLCDDVTQTTQA